MKLKKKNTTTLKKKSALFKKPKTETESKAKEPVIEQQYATLSDVMDKSRDLSFFYSGVEYDTYLAGCYNMGIRNFLMSYHYLTGRNLKDIFEKYPDIHLFVDSGAYTYQVDPKYAEYTIEHWENHIQRYLKWAERNKEHIFAIANLDIEGLVGAETVTRWNREYFEPFMLRTGIPVCFVYHDGLSDYTWDKYCERYPYVGFSSVNTNGETLDMNEYQQYLRTAEKYDTLVHGFGMTKIKELSELPYYTVDSTTWKVGMRYGKLIIFNGKTVQQIDQSNWDSKAIPLIQNYPVNIDIDKLWDYDEPEVIRANVYAFMLAEEYVQNSVKHLQYWKRAKAISNSLDNLPKDFFPSVEWLNGDKEIDDIKSYAKKLNINPEMDNTSDVALAIMDMVTFLNWDNPEYESRHSEYLEDNLEILHALHDKYVNRIAPDDDTKIRDLIKFYTECFEGKRDTLLNEGTNFDRIVKEREDYVDDTEYSLVDVSREEVARRLGNLLPASTSDAPEIDELDDEIFGNAGIIPVRDVSGKLVKGHVKLSKPKNIYSSKFPKFSCDTCNAAAKCPEFKAGYVCAYQKIFTGFDSRNADDVINAMQGMVNHNITRMQRAMVMETINGTVDGDVTALIDQNMKLMDNMRRIYESKSATVVKQTRVAQADGTIIDTMSVSNPQGGGILEKLFSQNKASEKPTEPKEEKPVYEADYVEVEEATADFDVKTE